MTFNIIKCRKHPKCSACDLFHCRLMVHEVTEEVGISKFTCHKILTQNFGMHCVTTKFVLRLVSGDQKYNHVDIGKELVDSLNVDENFLKSIITGDEPWDHGYNVKAKARSSQWVSETSPRPEKAWQIHCSVEVMLTVFFLIVRM